MNLKDKENNSELEKLITDLEVKVKLKRKISFGLSFIIFFLVCLILIKRDKDNVLEKDNLQSTTINNQVSKLKEKPIKNDLELKKIDSQISPGLQQEIIKIFSFINTSEEDLEDKEKERMELQMQNFTSLLENMLKKKLQLEEKNTEFQNQLEVFSRNPEEKERRRKEQKINQNNMEQVLLTDTLIHLRMIFDGNGQNLIN